MYVKKNLLLWVAVLALALPLLLVGTASAKFMSDGAVQNGTTGGWVTPNDMMCIVGVHTDGTLDVADTVTDARDCIYVQTGTMNGGTPFDLTGITSSAVCTSATSTLGDGAKHSWATSWCSKSLAGLDRTQQMCEGISGTWVTTGKCVAYGRDFKGQDANGTPLAIGTKGTVQAAGTGACYKKMRTGIAVASCPTIAGSSLGTKTATSVAAFGYAATSSQCTYDYGVNGAIDAAITAVDGTITAAGTVVNFAAKTTLGECIAAGGSWANWIPMSATGTIGSITGYTFDLTRQAVNADDGCLHCHSSVTEYNGPAERQKDGNLKTGHKNMLRKVTAGKNWAGPDADGIISVYTSAATGTIDFTTAKAMVSGTERDLLYLFGDWMAPAPAGLDVVVAVGTAAKYNGTSDYSCAACHSAGWGNSDATKGLCDKSQYTTSAACTGNGGVWTPITGVQAIGTPGYAGTQPGDAFPGITFGTAGQWDLEGIVCGRCHNATVPSVTRNQISGGTCLSTQTLCLASGGTWTTAGAGSCNGVISPAELYTTSAACVASSGTWTNYSQALTASAFPATASTGGGMGALAAGVLRNSLCFGCHQSMAKTSNGIGLDADLANPTALIVKSATTGTVYTPMFSGHVLGNSFLNSPHARFTGSVVPNSLGKYDLKTNTYENYNSKFRGYTCWQSSSSSSPAMTKADGTEIKDKTTCEGLYGAGAWRADTGSGIATDKNSVQGTCVTCHDVHESLFVAGEEGMRKECDSCHADSTYAAAVPGTVQVMTINHPETAGTPVGIDPADPCVVCHMPKPTSGDFPMHVWRINPDVNYSTFPTYAQFYGSCSLSTYLTKPTCTTNGGTWTDPTKKNANAAADGTYANAVWVDIDLACGQCHGGSKGSGAVTNGAPYRNKEELAGSAASMHGLKPVARFTSTHDTTTSFLENFDATTSVCPTGTCTYAWSFGGSGVTTSHQYANGTPVAVTLTVTDAMLSSSVTHTVTPYLQNHAPVALGLRDTYTGTTTLNATVINDAALTGSFTDRSTDQDNNVKAVTVMWGDGAISTQAATGGVFTHNYTKAGTFTITHTVTDFGGKGNTEKATVKIVPPKVTVSGNIKDINTGKNLSGVKVTMQKGTAVRTATTGFTGNYKFTNTMPGTYTITASKLNYTFTGSPTTISAPTATIVSAITGSHN